ncbi:zona pellucida sperm-binding protein 3-like isoform X1 [Sander lucioperca]|uniref:zona pellucida sperm-binding protein 3-like isoform X1 n=1 Tax=Sander lucioperca TaxID=283035 RepID=UPI001653DA5C|nr:zona pellucida sperm-binding protein 3-like isoform X1 [Sander lucioperca]
MKFFIRIKFSLFCGALSAAQQFNWNFQPAPNSFRDWRSNQDRPKVQEPAAVPQEKQSVHEPLSWRFPEPPAEEVPRFPSDFELKAPLAANSVSAICGENSVRVEAKKDLLGIGTPVRTADVTLGGCPATGEDDQVLIFESELHRCGSELLMSEDLFTYAFTLLYTASPLGGSQIIRTRDVQVSIQCQYQRKHDVSSGLLDPTWSPFIFTTDAEESLDFSITLMTDDWQSPRPSAQFLLGDMMKFEVSLKRFHHIPLRVTVDRCVATMLPSVDTVPRYYFLGNSGCLFDSQLTGSSSQFLPRSQDDKLQFEVEAFMFHQEDSGIIYITCGVKATVATAAVDATNKACSFSNGWKEASGSDRACSCCDTDCGAGSQSPLTGTGAPWHQEKVVGPIAVREKPLRLLAGSKEFRGSQLHDLTSQHLKLLSLNEKCSDWDIDLYFVINSSIMNFNNIKQNKKNNPRNPVESICFQLICSLFFFFFPFLYQI